MRDRFGIVQRLEYYSCADLTTIIQRSASLLNISISKQGAREIARRARGTPRIANRLLRRVRDYADVRSNGKVDHKIADAALKMLDVDQQGVNLMDRRFLQTFVEKFNGGPVGIDSLAAVLSEERDTIYEHKRKTYKKCC